MRTSDYVGVVWKEESGYVSKCPELGVASCGATLDEAIDNLKEAVALYIENAKELGLIEDLEASLLTKEKYTTRLEFSL